MLNCHVFAFTLIHHAKSVFSVRVREEKGGTPQEVYFHRVETIQGLFVLNSKTGLIF
jgi:hypothetical protein